MWSSLFSSLLLCATTRVQILRQLQNRSFQSIKLNKIPRTKLTSLKRKLKKLYAKADSLVDKILSCPRIRLSETQTLIMDGAETGVLLSDVAHQLRGQNADDPDIYLTLLDSAGISPTLVLNQNAKAQERGNWVPFKL